jgi:chromosome segregation ATPase
MEDRHGYVCDCTRHDHIDKLCPSCRIRREDQIAEQQEQERQMNLEEQIERLEREVLARDAEIADLKSKTVSAQIETATLRAYADKLDCHLRDAKANIVLLMSKIQEFEAREY